MHGLRLVHLFFRRCGDMAAAWNFWDFTAYRKNMNEFILLIMLGKGYYGI